MEDKDLIKTKNGNITSQGADIIDSKIEDQSIISILNHHLGEVGPNCFIQPNIPKEKINGVKKVYAKFVKEDQEILFLYEQPRKIFRDFKSFIFTRKGFGFTIGGFGFPFCIKYNKLNPDHITSRFGKLKVHGRVVRTGKVNDKNPKTTLARVYIPIHFSA